MLQGKHSSIPKSEIPLYSEAVVKSFNVVLRENDASRPQASCREVHVKTEFQTRPSGNKFNVRLFRSALHAPVFQDSQPCGTWVHKRSGSRGESQFFKLNIYPNKLIK